MKFGKRTYSIFAAALILAGLALYLYFRGTGISTGALPSKAARPRKPGKVIIAYAGDIVGSLDPCG